MASTPRNSASYCSRQIGSATTPALRARRHARGRPRRRATRSSPRRRDLDGRPMRRRNSSIDGMRCGARSRIVQPTTTTRAAGAAAASTAVRRRGRELAAQVQHDLDVVDVARADRVAIAAQRARPDRLDHLRRRQARLQRLVAAARGQQVEAGLLVRRAAEDAEAAADAVAEVQLAHPASGGSKTTSRLRMNAGSSACFIARCRSTISSPNMRRMYGFITPPKR